MPGELVFYTNPMSRGRIVRWMLEEIGAPYRTELLDYGTTMKADSFRTINPMMKVPAITHGGAVVTETVAICAYLADAFPDAGLAPALDDRAAYYRWLFFAGGVIEPAVIMAALGVVVPPDKAAMVSTMSDVIDTLEAAVAGRTYIAGDRFSAADVYVGSQIGWGMMFGTIEKRPAFEAYHAGLYSRPAAVRARAIDDALMPEEMRGKM